MFHSHQKKSTLYTSLIISSLIAGFSPACSNSEFSGGGGAAKKSVPKGGNVTTAPSGALKAEFNFSDGEKSMKVSAIFLPKDRRMAANAQNYEQDFELLPESLRSEPDSGFPQDAADKITKASLKAALSYSAKPTESYKVQIIMDLSGGSAAKNTSNVLTLTSQNSSPAWSKSEGPVTAFGEGSGSSSGDCKLQASGQQPKNGVYAVVLTKPAPCDFRLKEITVGRSALRSKPVPIGTYWRSSSEGIAHKLPLTSVIPKLDNGMAVDIDNGFILIQPDNKSYLLADAGSARMADTTAKSASVIANDLSQTLGFGSTELLQPSPGSAANNYADGTLFKKGSVIAIYDDTPDMGGSIDVKTLLGGSGGSGIVLNWSGEVVDSNAKIDDKTSEKKDHD